jgi:hypothetical protein
MRTTNKHWITGLALAGGLLTPPSAAEAGRTLDSYWVDVAGGAADLARSLPIGTLYEFGVEDSNNWKSDPGFGAQVKPYRAIKPGEHRLIYTGSVNGPWSRYIDPTTVGPGTGNGLVRYPRLEPRDAECAAKLKKRTLTNLYNERPTWLNLAHQKLDAAVAGAYGWPPDLSDDQILERLLALNLERADDEAKTAKVKAPRISRERAGGEML